MCKLFVYTTITPFPSFLLLGSHRRCLIHHKNPPLRRHSRGSSGRKRHGRYSRRRGHSNRPPPSHHIGNDHRFHHRLLKQHESGKNVVCKRPRGRFANDYGLQHWRRLPASTVAALLSGKEEIERFGRFEEGTKGGKDVGYHHRGVCDVLAAIFRYGGIVAC